MKRLSILMTLVACIGFSAFAQQQNNHPRSSYLPNQFTGKKLASHRMAQLRTDTTVWQNFLDCDTFIYDYPLINSDNGDNSGFIFGHNVFIDSAKAEKFEGITGDKIAGVLLWFGDATSTSSTQKIHVKIWDDNGTGGTPGTELATVDVTQQSIATDVTNSDLTLVWLTTPINMPAGGNFYAGWRQDYKKKQGVLTYDSTRAVAGLLSWAFDPTGYYVNDCSDDSLENTAWEQYHYTSTTTDGYDGKWHSLWEGWGLAFRSQIYPIVTSASGCTVTVSPTSATVCKKKAASLTATANPSGGTFTWAPSTGLNVTTGATVSAKPNSTTTYTVTNSGGCSATVTVTVNPQPTMNVTQDACSNHHILLHANANPNTGVKYQWLLNGSKITGATLSTYSAGTSGSYKVKVTITLTGCVKTSPAVTVTISCKESDAIAASGMFDATAFPNPFTKSVNVNIATGSTEAATVSLMDFSGRTLNTFKDVDASAPFEINEDLSPGVYFIKVAQGSNEKMIKVVKSE